MNFPGPEVWLGRLLPVRITGVPLGPVTGVPDPATLGASVGVPLGPMTVGAPLPVTGKPLGPTGFCAACARERSVDEGTRASPSEPILPAQHLGCGSDT